MRSQKCNAKEGAIRWYAWKKEGNLIIVTLVLYLFVFKYKIGVRVLKGVLDNTVSDLEFHRDFKKYP